MSDTVRLSPEDNVVTALRSVEDGAHVDDDTREERGPRSRLEPLRKLRGIIGRQD